MTTRDFVTDLPFEAGFLDGPVWRLDNPEHARDAVVMAREAGVRLMSCRVPEPDDRSSSLRLAGFRKVEVLLTFARDLEPEDMPASVRLAKPDEADAAACAEIGRTTFSFDRFHADPLISNDAADALKEIWVKNAVMGRADCVLVAEEDGRIVAFNACLLKGRTAIIDLIGVDASVRGRGFGRQLVHAMHAHYKDRADRIQLGTQLANERSLAFYGSLGFEEVACQQTWHWTP